MAVRTNTTTAAIKDVGAAALVGVHLVAQPGAMFRRHFFRSACSPAASLSRFIFDAHCARAMPLVRPPKGGVGRESRSGGKQKSKQSAVKSSGQAAAKSGQEGNVNQLAHDRFSPSLRRQIVLERDALELFAEVLDPILRLLALHRGHESRNRMRAASRAQHPVLGMNLWGIIVAST